MKIVSSSSLSKESSRPVAGLSQGQGCGHMATEHDTGTCFCLYTDCNGKRMMKFLLCHVSDTPTEEVPPKKKRSPPVADLDHFGSSQLYFGASFVSVGSMLYCIGGHKGDIGFEHCNEVRKFNTKISEFEVDPIPPPMNEGRCFPFVVAIGKIIYAFDGLRPTATEDSSYAECLNTDMPIAMQKWRPLKPPPFRLKLGFCSSFAIPYKTDFILIADKNNSKDALLYNVSDGNWMEYKPLFKYPPVSRPVSVVCEKTVYWIDKMFIFAYDYGKHVHYTGFLCELLYKKDYMYSPLTGPYLMHLKDDIFCCFTLYAVNDIGPSQTGVVQCTTFQVTKFSSGCAQGDLHLRAMGYKSYKCGKLFSLFGVVPIQTRICLSETKKLRSGSKEKKRLKEKEMMQSRTAVPPYK